MEFYSVIYFLKHNYPPLYIKICFAIKTYIINLKKIFVHLDEQKETKF